MRQLEALNRASKVAIENSRKKKYILGGCQVQDKKEKVECHSTQS